MKSTKVLVIPLEDGTDESVYVVVEAKHEEEAIQKVHKFGQFVTKSLQIDKDGYDPLWSRYFC